jgi:diguanylate cyclase (GGDEF)-like protein
MKILLVDDTKTERLIVSAYLKKLGHTTICAENGHQAIELFKSKSPDLVLMDVIMPEMDGHEAARCLRKNESDWVPIIFLSGRVAAEDIVAGIEAGGDDYLTKPVDFTVLSAKMTAMQRIAKMRQKLIGVSSELAQANAELKKLVNIDGLTGLANRRYLDEYLRVEIARSMRNKHELSVILCDVDFFKKYNDTYGHLKGDDCLKSVAKALESACKRSTDLLARYGGEEFAVILPDTNGENAAMLANQMRQAIEDLNEDHSASDLGKVTISMGVYCAVPQSKDESEKMLHKADEALYEAKQTGRNRVELSK